MCGCERHGDPNAPCTCDCCHRDVDKPVRLKRYIYKHAHDCSRKNELFVHRPSTRGDVMFPIVPVCIETETELMRVRVEDDV